jgi:signal peptidase
MNRRHRILSAFKISSALLIVVAAIGLAVNQGKGGKLLSVQSGSMVPAINKGDLVQVKNVPDSELAVGDVITYVSQDKKTTITHRISGILENDPSGNNIVTKGDANANADKPIEAASVVGRVERTIPYAGYAVDFIKQPLGLILIIYLPALVVIVGEMKRLTAYYRRFKLYALPGLTSSRLHPPKSHGAAVYAVSIGAVMVLVAGLSGTALALLQNSAQLVGNKIVINDIDEPPVEEPETPPTTVTCTNNNNVNISSNTNQSATSGNVESTGNTTGGSAQSGNASNSSSTSVNVNIDNTCPTSAASTPVTTSTEQQQ